MDSVLYHFTSRYQLPLILTDGFLKLCESNLREPSEEDRRNIRRLANNFTGEGFYKPVVWLSRTVDASNCAITETIVDKSEILITLREREHYRNWTIWSKENRIKNSWAKRLTRNYNPNSWYVSEKTIPLTCDEVVRIENTKTGEVLIDIDAGKRVYSCTLEKPPGLPEHIFEAWIGSRELKEGDVVEFTL